MNSKAMNIEITDLSSKNQLLHLVVNSQQGELYKNLERAVFSYLRTENPEVVCEVIKSGSMYSLLTIGAEYGFDELIAFQILRAYILCSSTLSPERIRDWMLSILTYTGEHNGDIYNIARNIPARIYRMFFSYSNERGSLDNDIHLLRRLNRKYPAVVSIWESVAPNRDILNRLTKSV